MSGHSKWSKIKRAKGAADVNRSQVFTKLARELTVAARLGDPDPSLNFRLRLAVDRARQQNMPMESIDRAIKRGSSSGGDNSANLDEVIYEGYTPGGAAIMVIALTDNRNRSASEIRHAFDKHNSKLGQSGAVSWLFQLRGVITLEAEPNRAEEIAMLAIDVGAEEFELEGTQLELISTPERFEELRLALENEGVSPGSAEVTMVPKNLTTLDDHSADLTLRLMDRLEELDDVQKVFTNADFPESALAQYQAAS